MDTEELSLHEGSVYLLDTSTLLWLIMEPSRLSEAAKAIWQNPKKLVAVSVVSCWEVVIKVKKRFSNRRRRKVVGTPGGPWRRFLFENNT